MVDSLRVAVLSPRRGNVSHPLGREGTASCRLGGRQPVSDFYLNPRDTQIIPGTPRG